MEDDTKTQIAGAFEVIVGLLLRHAFTALGGALALPPVFQQAVDGQANSIASVIVGAALGAFGLGWSYLNKRKSGQISKPLDITQGGSGVY